MKTIKTLSLSAVCLLTALTIIIGSGVVTAHADKIIIRDSSTITVDPKEDSLRADEKLVIPDSANSDTVPVGTRSTVLPEDCTKVQRKSGVYYSCKNGIYLQAQGKYYVVVEKP